MTIKPSYEELEQRVEMLESLSREHDHAERELERIFNFSPDLIGSGNLQGYFTKINTSFRQILGYAEEEILEHPFTVFVHDEDMEETRKALADAAKGKKNIYIQNRYRCKDGSWKWIEWKVLVIAEEDKFIAVGREITERKRTEKLIEETLTEKEILLREVHHRVKNNLEIISSLLDLSGMQTDNKDLQGLWQIARSRIHSMALIHDQLYHSERFDQVRMDRHTRRLMDYLSSVHSASENAIDLRLTAAEVRLTVSQAIPCALVLNELINNSFKHAFKQREKGRIQVFIGNSLNRSSSEVVSFGVKDDGIGISDKSCINGAGGLGFKLVRHLVEGQLKGGVRFNLDAGTEICVEFAKTK